MDENNNYNMDTDTDTETQILKSNLSISVKEYLTLDEQVSKLNELVKIRKKRMKELSDDIMLDMAKNEIDYINIRNGVLIYDKKEGFKGLSKRVIESGLSTFFNEDEQKASEVLETIINSREKIIRSKLKLKRF
jgi:hypothetical protein